MNRSLLWLLLVLLLAVTATARCQTKNGFNVAGSLVPADEILSGGPPRDGIPAIDTPQFVQANAARFLEENDRVLGITRNGVSKAYPVAILNWHEIVNDRFDDEPIVVTYCPLCGTGIAYLSKVGGQLLDFGVSGLLYNSDMLLYDRKTQSLWSQIRQQAISGPMRGTKLKSITVVHTSWADWKQRHPNTRVLSTDTGHQRDYDRNPYAGYENERDLLFPVQLQDERYHPKEWVLGVEVDGHFKAYPFAELKEAGRLVRDTIAGRNIVITYDPEHQTATAADIDGDWLITITAYWFAWYAFHPDTEVYRANGVP
jgi:hypothetical protein